MLKMRIDTTWFRSFYIIKDHKHVPIVEKLLTKMWIQDPFHLLTIWCFAENFNKPTAIRENKFAQT